MIQRRQSLYLLVAAVLIFAVPFVDLATVPASGNMDAVHFNIIDNPVLFAVDMLVGILAVITIFSFRSLRHQQRLAVLTAVLSAMLLVGILFTVQMAGMMNCIGYAAPLFLVLAMIGAILAAVAIRSDRRLRDSVIRLR